MRQSVGVSSCGANGAAIERTLDYASRPRIMTSVLRTGMILWLESGVTGNCYAPFGSGTGGNDFPRAHNFGKRE